jgi:hypothetical protein
LIVNQPVLNSALPVAAILRFGQAMMSNGSPDLEIQNASMAPRVNAN